MKRILFFAGLAVTLFSSCGTDSSYRITADNVGPLTKETKVSELQSVFEKDSVVGQYAGANSSQIGSAIEVYDEEGKQLLSLMPTRSEDPKTIKTVQIFDPRYETEKGISLNSTFGDLQKAYEISRIQTLLSSVVVFVDDINAYFTIDKNELPGELRFDRDIKISAAQIPNDAKIKYFMIGW